MTDAARDREAYRSWLKDHMNEDDGEAIWQAALAYRDRKQNTCARGEGASAMTESVNFVSEVHPRPDDPSCTVCGALMVPREYRCLSCGSSTGLTGPAKCPTCLSADRKRLLHECTVYGTLNRWHSAQTREPASLTAEQWEVYAPEGAFHGTHSHPHSYSICVDKLDDVGHYHQCVALVFGETDEEALNRAKQIVDSDALRAERDQLQEAYNTILDRQMENERLRAERDQYLAEVKKLQAIIENGDRESAQAEQERDRLREALRNIADNGDCDCEHDTEDCCANHDPADYCCPECIAAKALAQSAEPKKGPKS